MFDHLFPAGVATCSIYREPGMWDLTHFDALHPLEKALVSHSVARRRAEFADARWCAHQAMQKLGVADAPILKGDRGMPLWPSGLVGSLSHTDGLRAAVVARDSSVRSVGLDVEPAQRLPDQLIGSIARPGELARMSSLNVECVDRLLFCAKEATYKSWFPITRRWLDFDDADIDLRADGTFVSYLLVRPAPVPFIEGRWSESGGYLWASTFVPV